MLTFFGFMHSEAIGIAKMPMVALSYAAVAVTLLVCAKFAVASPRAEPLAHREEPMLAT